MNDNACVIPQVFFLPCLVFWTYTQFAILQQKARTYSKQPYVYIMYAMYVHHTSLSALIFCYKLLKPSGDIYLYLQCSKFSPVMFML